MSGNNSDAVLLFSGGRDSSLAACLLANKGTHVHLLTCDNGVSVATKLSAYRLRELKTAFGDRIAGRTIAMTMGLFRRIALANIEHDFERFKKNLIVLGCPKPSTFDCRNDGGRNPA
jgi:predicted subunit of tRNA(5-methylaminomethyl-2-thiouridylate) methyltransferase